MSENITSPQNPQIKKVVGLREAKDRKEKNLTIVEGVREVQRAMEAKVTFKEIYYCPDYVKKEILFDFPTKKTFKLSPAAFEKIAYGDRREGVLAVCEISHLAFTDLK